MSNLETLQPFKKGNDPRRNIKGKPKGAKSLTTILKEKLKEIDPKTGKTQGEGFMKQVMASGVRTDGQSRKLIMQYSEGMPLQKTSLETELKISFDGSFIKPKAREMIPETPPKTLKKGHLSDLQHKDIAEDSSANKEPVREDKEDKTPHP